MNINLLSNVFVNRLFNILKPAIIAVIVIAGLYWSSRYNYLLFHSLTEVFSIIIATTIFLIAWNTRLYTQSQYFLFIGIAYFFIAGLDLIHTLAFPGMQIFDSEEFYANQFWIAARYMESISFLLAFVFLGKAKKVNANITFIIYSLVSMLILLSIFWWKIFPECYIAGEGQTPFKIISEYIIVFFLLVCIYLLSRYKQHFDPKIYKLLTTSFILTVLSELSFTLYISNYDFANMIGHYLKIFSFYFIYKAVVETGFSQPLSIFFRELKQSEEALTNLNKTKDKFFSIIAHDLKSPFNSLIGFSELLINNYEVFSDDERKKLFLLINSSSKKAHNLLDNLLHWSRTQTGSLINRPENFDIVELAHENIGLLEGSAKEKNISLNGPSHQTVLVFADKNMISTVLRNLINNAIKFTSLDGSIHITIDNSLSGSVEISIADTGVGIPQKIIENLFNIEKNRTTPGTANEKGSGLGLIICKEFVEKNGGGMKVTSELQKGTVFSFTLPKGKPEITKVDENKKSVID